MRLSGGRTAACAVTYNAEVPLLLSEIDPVQNNAVNTAVNTPGFSETMVWSGPAGRLRQSGFADLSTRAIRRR